MARKLHKLSPVTVNIGVGVTLIAIVPSLGLTAINVRMYGGPNANVLVPTAAGSNDGLADVEGSSLALTVAPAGGGPTNHTQGHFWGVRSSTLGYPIHFPFTRLYGAMAAGGGNVTFDIWPVYDDVSHPNLPDVIT